MKTSVLDTVGSPLVQIGSPAGATIAAKVESKNPGGSAKDRPAGVLRLYLRGDRRARRRPDLYERRPDGIENTPLHCSEYSPDE